MAKIARRLVMTGHDAAGVSRVMSDQIVSGVPGPAMPGSEVALVWGSDAPLRYPDDGAMPSHAGFYAPLHGARVLEMYLAPRSSQYIAYTTDDPESGASALTADKPGMHRTATTDIIIVMEGKVDCELDEETVTLNTGDVLIQNGTIHAWLNPHDEPCRFLCAMMGAENKLCE
jgi:mannose-6-phosphate isomerase-like protein (cupin superfamily)